MSFKEFSRLYRRGEEVYSNFIRLSIGVFNLIIRLDEGVDDSDKSHLEFAKRFLSDFHSIDDTEISILKEYPEVKELNTVYNKVMAEYN